MKKVALITVLISMMTFGAKAQLLDFDENHNASIGFNVGAVGYHLNEQGLNTNLIGLGLGGSLSLNGIYLDFMYQRPEHRYSDLVGVPDWNDHTALTINIGYQIPVLPWLLVTPVVGYSNETTGITYADVITAENSSIVHKYRRDNIYPHFNYGLGIMLKPIKQVGIGGFATSHAIYGNISFFFTKDMMKKANK